MNAMLSNVLVSVAATALLTTVLYKLLQLNFWWGVPFLIGVAVVVFFTNRSWKISAADVSGYLNRSIPQLEESAGLVLKPGQSLSFLEQLQLKKVDQQLGNIKVPNPFRKKLLIACIAFAAAIFLSVILFKIPNLLGPSNGKVTEQLSSSVMPERVLPTIRSVSVIVTPPHYTGRSPRRQDRFNLQVEENASAKWELQTSVSMKTVELRFNDNVVIKLQATDAGRTRWAVQKTIAKPGFYQVKIDEQLSELYKIEVTKDKPPVITVRSPKPNTLIDYGQPQQVMLNISLSDDYSIKASHISATIASGSGEAVKFKEQQIAFNNFNSGRQKYELQQRIDLAKLGVQSGDELYFYITATDSHNQEARSDIYIVTIQDTAQLMSIDGLVNGLDIKPEFFRSQRQIIIETEQLIKGRDTMSVQAYNDKSNELGIDQKLLRLRYGKFLGEESSTEIGGDHDHEETGHTEPSEFGNADQIMDQYAHKHDIAEDATFFDPETKKQLKATLAEMWKAEKELRTYKPVQALPFEYKALRLLKDLQQKSRVYVAKTSFKTTPLEPAKKRLTGDLSKIGQPSNQKDFKVKADDFNSLRRALGVLEQLKVEPLLKSSSIEILQQAGQQLSNKAAANPHAYLSSLEALRRILNKTSKPNDAKTVQKALQAIIQSPGQLPFQTSTNPPSKLSTQYFNNLKSNNGQ
jgi:hypothetical protein